MPGEQQPLLPPIEDLSKYADPTAGAEPPAPGTNPQEEDAPPPSRPLESPPEAQSEAPAELPDRGPRQPPPQ
jgi:hypothetical protein